MEDHAHAHTGAGGAAPKPFASTSRLAHLVAQMAQGRQEALASLYDETAPLVNGLLHRILAHAEDAEEVLLDVYMKAWKNAAAYSEQRGSVQSWLVITARTAAIDRIRQRRAQPRIVDIETPSGFDLEAPGPSPEILTAAAQRRHLVRGLLSALPADQRQAVELAFFGGLSHGELAEKLGQPLGTVKSRIRMGLIRLRTLLQEADVL